MVEGLTLSLRRACESPEKCKRKPKYFSTKFV